MKVAMIHAAYRAIAPVVNALHELAPEVATEQFVNEHMLAAMRKRGRVGEEELRTFTRLMFEAMESDADCILVCCSVFCSYVPLMRNFTSKPVIAVNEPMLARAGTFDVIGIVSTNPTSTTHTQKQIERTMGDRAGSAKFIYADVPEAAKANESGDKETHDRIIAEAGLRLAEQGAQCVVLSQLTMEGAKRFMTGCPVPILTTSEEGAKAVVAELAKLAAK